MINEQVIRKKIDRIQEDLIHLKPFLPFTFDQIAKNYNTHKAVERIIEVIANTAIDVNQHIIVEEGKGNLPFDFTKSFLILSDLGVYPKEFAKTVSKSAGLRNILVHEYQELDEKKFYASIKDCYRDYTKYCRYVLEFLKSSS